MRPVPRRRFQQPEKASMPGMPAYCFELLPFRVCCVRAVSFLFLAVERTALMVGRSFTWKTALMLCPILLLQSCSHTPHNRGDFQASSGPRLQRESMLKAAWRGRPYNTLVEAFGSPKMVMNVPGYRPVATSIIVYDASDKVSKCIDAFTVVVPGENEEIIISDYFCR
jgi:hypothetical protein